MRRLTRAGWAAYRFFPLLAVLILFGFIAGWAVALFFAAPFVALVAWILVYGPGHTKRVAERLRTDPAYAAKVEREQTAYFRAMGLGIPIVLGIVLVLLIVAAATR